MVFLRFENVLAGSIVYNWLTNVLKNSLTFDLLRRLIAAAITVMRGSMVADFIHHRIWPVFMVDNYLDCQLRIDSTTLNNSVVWARCHDLVLWSKNAVSFRPDLTFFEKSRISEDIKKTGSLDGRQITALFILFLVIYYAVRLVLHAFFPDGYLRAGWGAGVALALLIAGSLKLISKQ